MLSAGLIFLGVWILTAYTKFEHLSDALSPHLLPAYVLVAVGIILFVLGTIGCVGVVRDHKCLVGLVTFQSYPFDLQDVSIEVVSREILSVQKSEYIMQSSAICTNAAISADLSLIHI